MELPAILPTDLHDLAVCNTDLELYDRLLRNTERLVRFFAFAADDETWSGNHQQFHKLALGWFTAQFVQNRLSDTHAEEIVRALHEHLAILEPLLSKPIALDFSGHTTYLNPLLIGVASPFLRDLLRTSEKGHLIPLKEVDPSIGSYLLRYIETADVGDLWRWTQKEVESVLKVAERWKLFKLQDECQQILGRYVTPTNMVETLLAAEKKGRIVLMSRCIDLFNASFTGAKLQLQSQRLSFTFADFSDKALAFFNALKGIIVYLGVGGKLTLQSHFPEVVVQCPRLTGLDLSGSDEWSPHFSAIPPRVQELNLARCGWLADKALRGLIALVPHITHLSLSQDTQLTYVGLGEVRRWPLKELDLSRCSQLEDADLTLILQALPQLLQLNLLACKRLSDQAFYDLARRGTSLQQLNASRSSITDGALIEIGTHCHALESIVLNHCLNLSHAGLQAFLKVASLLRFISLQENFLDSEALQQLSNQFPQVKIVT